MNYRTLGKTGYTISEIGIGTWQLGGKWGEKFDHSKALEILQKSYDGGINVIDTADIYQDGRSERTVGEFIKTVDKKIYVITKVGRKTSPHSLTNYSRDSINRYVDDCLENLQVSNLDLMLLHCPPSEVYQDKLFFQTLDTLKQEGKIAHYGVSVETVQEALHASQFDISAVEIIFNMFRLKPRDLFFKEALKKNIGIIARVPLASGLLTGKFDRATEFGKSDHRNFNRNGEAFDKGETFSGVHYETGLKAVEKLKKIFGVSLAPKALKFILMHKEISTVIPGASSTSQVENNLLTQHLPELTKTEMDAIAKIYDEYFRKDVEKLW